ncbi:hypothetical protein [Streptomyces sp. NPDC007883]|uniref:hypothetical protein n=1 Tax=Streptomyces sp. NPDC007883 TaxID=3155116 RepID=UPI0033D562F5
MPHPTDIRTRTRTRPRLLDLFLCQGGAAKGYADARGCTWMTNRETLKSVPAAHTQWIAPQHLTHERSTAA